ncbi:MAG: nucleotidyltransferase family protein [Lachnospiraceae bacterium]|nr:nucleotidyltransferase family protein [Lachnospiraceae bacterium]
MASGLGKRFGSNKLMADFKGKPLIQWTLDVTEKIFLRRVVVTRHQEVEALCRKQGIPVIFHDLPWRSDTIRLGLQALSPSLDQDLYHELDGCMFCPGDQPLLRPDTIAALALSAASEKDLIWRTAWEDTVGSPVLFPKWAFPELLTLPKDKGGSFILTKYPEQVRKIPVRDPYELMDIDSPEDLKFLSEL